MTAIPNRPVDSSDNGDIEIHTNPETGEQTIIYRCSSCGTTEHITALNRQVFEWVVLRYPIQKAFPDMSVEQREALLMNCCVDCSEKIWENLSGEDD